MSFKLLIFNRLKLESTLTGLGGLLAVEIDKIIKDDFLNNLKLELLNWIQKLIVEFKTASMIALNKNLTEGRNEETNKKRKKFRQFERKREKSFFFFFSFLVDLNQVHEIDIGRRMLLIRRVILETG